MTAALYDLEVYADRYSEMLETRELEYRQSLDDASEETAFNDWADREASREAERLESEEDRHRDHRAPVTKLDWPAVRDGGAA